MHQVNFRTDFIECVDGFVGEETVCDIPFCQFDTSCDGIIGVAHMMMSLITVFHVVQDLQRLVGRGRLHNYLLETAFQGTVFFNAVTIFI